MNCYGGYIFLKPVVYRVIGDYRVLEGNTVVAYYAAYFRI